MVRVVKCGEDMLINDVYIYNDNIYIYIYIYNYVYIYDDDDDDDDLLVVLFFCLVLFGLAQAARSVRSDRCITYCQLYFATHDGILCEGHCSTGLGRHYVLVSRRSRKFGKLSLFGVRAHLCAGSC